MAVKINDVKAVHEFLAGNGIEYVLTGTAALFFHGLLPHGYEVHDIDIRIFVTDDNRSKIQQILKQQQQLSQLELSQYPDATCFSFYVGSGIKVNAFEQKQNEKCNYAILLVDCGFMIKVHDALDALKAKFSLSRPKDYQFNNQLVATLGGFFQ